MREDKNTIFGLINKYSIELVLLFMFILGALAHKSFLTHTNLVNILRQVAVNGFLAIGMSFVIINGCIDLSVSGVVGLSGMVLMYLLTRGVSMYLAIPLVLCIGIVVGIINGYNIARGMAPFIMTMAMDTMIRGIAYLTTNGQPISVYGLSPSFDFIGQGYIFKVVPVPVALFILVILGAYFVLNHTTFGRHIYAIGGNSEAARLSGISVLSTKIKVYCVSGFLASLTAVVLTSRLSSCDPTVGTGYQLDAIAATVIGGASMSGGEGKISRTVVGIFIIGMLLNVLNLLNINPYFQQVIKGVIIYAAVWGDNWNLRKAK